MHLNGKKAQICSQLVYMQPIFARVFFRTKVEVALTVSIFHRKEINEVRTI
jgi:hypothetical protein